MKVLETNTIKTLLIQKQSQTTTFLNNSFNSLLEQNNTDLEKEITEESSEPITNYQQNLQYKAFLNKLSLGLAG